MLWNVKNEGLFNPSSTGNPDVQDRPSPSISGPIRLIVCSFFLIIWKVKFTTVSGNQHHYSNGNDCSIS